MVEKIALATLTYLENHPEALQKVFTLLLQAVVKHLETPAPAES